MISRIVEDPLESRLVLINRVWIKCGSRYASGNSRRRQKYVIFMWSNHRYVDLNYSNSYSKKELFYVELEVLVI